MFANRDPKPAFWEVKRVYQDIGVSPVADEAANPVDLGDAGTRQEEAAGVRRAQPSCRMPAPRGPGILPGARVQTTQSAKSTVLGEAATVEVFNKYFFRNLSDFDIRWSLSADGNTVEHGTLPALDLAPRHKLRLVIPFKKIDRAPASDYQLRVSFHLKTDSSWQKQGYEVAASQMAIGPATRERPLMAMAATPASLTVDEQAQRIVVRGNHSFAAEFDRQTGGLTSLRYGGNEMLAGTTKLNAFRTFTDNDKWAANGWFGNGLHTLTDKALDLKVDRGANGVVRVVARIRSQGERSDRVPEQNSGSHKIETGRALGENDFHFDSTQAWTVFPDGTVAVDIVGSGVGPSIVLPKIGQQWLVAPAL